MVLLNERKQKNGICVASRRVGRVSIVYDDRHDLASQPVEQVTMGEKQNSC
jgi:hypothetical protein